MTDKIIVLSDIHANLSALDSVILDFESRGYRPDGILILGDTVNYGMRPNEVIRRLESLEAKYGIAANLFGNHEKAIFDGDKTHFSTERGKLVLDFTRNRLTEESLRYMDTLSKEGHKELEIAGLKILTVHGSISDPYWGRMDNEELGHDGKYAQYDFVISGHSHIPHLIERFYASDNPEYRNRKRTVFLNPGSVGQPRNHNPRAQYIYMEISSEIFHFNSVPYDIDKERFMYTAEVDNFYSKRLIIGI